MANNVSSAGGRFRRLTQVALNADHTLAKVDVLADDFHSVARNLDIPLSDIERTMVHIDQEITLLAELRMNADGVLATAQRILDLVEWILTPAFVAKKSTERAVAYALQVRDAVREVINPRPDHNAVVVDLAEVRRLVG